MQCESHTPNVAHLLGDIDVLAELHGRLDDVRVDGLVNLAICATEEDVANVICLRRRLGRVVRAKALQAARDK